MTNGGRDDRRGGSRNQGHVVQPPRRVLELEEQVKNLEAEVKEGKAELLGADERWRKLRDDSLAAVADYKQRIQDATDRIVALETDLAREREAHNETQRGHDRRLVRLASDHEAGIRKLMDERDGLRIDLSSVRGLLDQSLGQAVMAEPPVPPSPTGDSSNDA